MTKSTRAVLDLREHPGGDGGTTMSDTGPIDHKATGWQAVPGFVVWTAGIGLCLVMALTAAAVVLTLVLIPSGNLWSVLGDDVAGAGFVTAVVAAVISVLALREAVHLPVLSVHRLDRNELHLSAGPSPRLQNVSASFEIHNSGTAVARNIAVIVKFGGVRNGELVAPVRWRLTSNADPLTVIWRGGPDDLVYVDVPLTIHDDLSIKNAEYADPGNGKQLIEWVVVSDASRKKEGHMHLAPPPELTIA